MPIIQSKYCGKLSGKPCGNPVENQLKACELDVIIIDANLAGVENMVQNSVENYLNLVEYLFKTLLIIGGKLRKNYS